MAGSVSREAAGVPGSIGSFYLYARSLLTGVFGSEARVTGNVSREAVAVPGPDMYRPLVVNMGDFAAIGNHF